MNAYDRHGPGGDDVTADDSELALAAEPLTEADYALLDSVRALYDRTDPVPDGLVERIQFEITLDALHAELATLTQVDLATSGARSASTESVRTVTFTAETMTTMVTISAQPDGSVRVDGWVAPGAGLLVEVLLADGARRTYTDGDGRFVVEDLPAGLAKFALHTTDAAGSPHTVVSPTIEL
ncbi:MAG TPA: hypothetical protein VEX57_13650 [Microlunatus sp.]|nr:hypothetical protein [Microlunatus sp.]